MRLQHPQELCLPQIKSDAGNFGARAKGPSFGADLGGPRETSEPSCSCALTNFLQEKYAKMYLEDLSETVTTKAQQRGVQSTSQILTGLVEGVEGEFAGKIWVVDLTPSRFLAFI